jgi:hypothetical protein
MGADQIAAFDRFGREIENDIAQILLWDVRGKNTFIVPVCRQA